MSPTGDMYVGEYAVDAFATEQNGTGDNSVEGSFAVEDGTLSGGNDVGSVGDGGNFVGTGDVQLKPNT